MCGIVGLVYRDPQRPVPTETIGTMCAALRHRGPDDEGRHVAGRVGLGMRRLSIIDLGGGHQPIYNEDRSKVIVFNGEIYNYRGIREELLARGHRLQTHSDTETILHLYEEMGERCVERLQGMFAFAIWDASERSLFVARDRFGIKPLYLVRAPWGLAFASELKALVAAGLTERQLDWDALDMFFQLTYIPAPATPFRDVRKLEPAHTLLWRADREPADQPAPRRYWELPRETTPAPPRVEREVLEWLDQSVTAHLESDVPVAAFLSGGLDSSAVVASMAACGKGEVPHAFTARYHGTGAEEADETELARALATRYGAELSVIDIHPRVTELLEPIVWALDEPHADDSAMPTWLISEAVGARYKVALTGIGGDELFAGYRRHFGLLLSDYYGRLPHGLRQAAGALAARLREPQDGSLGVNRLKRFLRSGAGGVPERFLGFLGRITNGDRSQLYAPALRPEITGTAALGRLQHVYDRGGAPRGLRAGLYLDYQVYLPDDILTLSDRLSMAHSLEIRVPFVDHVLVERVFPLPDRVKMGWWRGKHLLREALRPRLPEAHFNAPKRGFVGPTGAWLRNELRETLTDELSSERITRLGYFEPATVTRLLDEHFSRRQNREGILWAMLCFTTWHRLYVERTPSPPRLESAQHTEPS